MALNPWVKYVDRSFTAIKASVLARLKIAVPEITDLSNSNLLIVIVDIFAGVSELLNYYIDITARELFLPTARRFSSVLKLAGLAGYVGKAKVSSYAALTLQALDAGSLPVDAPEDFQIPLGNKFTDADGNVWATVEATTFRVGYSSAIINVRQFEVVTSEDLGASDGSADQTFALPLAYAHDSLELVIDGDVWNRVTSLGFSNPTDKDFTVTMQSDGLIYLVFGDNTNGAIPGSGFTIFGTYKTTEGLVGNVGENTITIITTAISPPAGINSLTVTNLSPALGGKDVEEIEDIRKAIPLSLRTLNRAVSRQDYRDIAVLAPSIRGALIGMTCGSGITLYVVAEGGGNPTSALLADTLTFMEARSMVSIPITMQPSGETHIKVKLVITGRYRVSGTTLLAKTIAALENLYNPYVATINQDVRKSDIVATVDNLPEVDYLTMTWMYAEPYLRPSNLNTALDYAITVLSTSLVRAEWKVIFADGSPDKFNLYKNNLFIQEMDLATTYPNLGGAINMAIASTPAGAVNGDSWTFVTYPFDTDIILDDASIPIIAEADLTIETLENYG